MIGSALSNWPQVQAGQASPLRVATSRKASCNSNSPCHHSSSLLRLLIFITFQNNQVAPSSLQEWTDLHEQSDYRIALHFNATKTVGLSTVFLGMNYVNPGQPELFETVLFDQGDTQHSERYATWGKAVLGHQDCVDRFLAAPRITIS